jgi:hypothetical protein
MQRKISNSRKMLTLSRKKVNVQYSIVAYLDSVHTWQASLREPHKGVILQSATGEELSALLPFVLDRAFKGEL